MADQEEFVLEWLRQREDLREKEKEKREFSSPDPDKPGKLAIVDGELMMKKPQGRGRWPTIAPAKGGLVKVFCGDQEIKTPFVVEDVSKISFEICSKPASSSFEIIISSDKMEVWLETKFIAGTEYQISDRDYTDQLVVNASESGKILADPLDPDLIFNQAKDLGIKVDLQTARIINSCREIKDQKVLIATGNPPQEPIDGKIDVVWDLKEKKQKKEKGGRIDPLDRGFVSAVEPGEVLAYWQPPVEGRPGLNVFGEIVKPRSPKLKRFIAGEGVRLIEEGTTAIAEIAGRPCFEGLGRLCVKPQLIIPSDVDISTGNVEFTGDITVLGDVTESLTVKTGGLVEVKGSVYHARVVGGNGVFIQKNVTGGQVRAGGFLDDCTKAQALLKQLIPELKSLRKTFNQLKQHPRFSTGDLKTRGHGYLIKLILETRFPRIPKLSAKVQKLFQNQDGLEEDLCQAFTVLGYVSKSFLGTNPLAIKSISEVDRQIECLEEIGTVLEGISGQRADIKAHYAQNARLEATGNIVISGSLVYGCEFTAGYAITMAGSCRRGTYFAGKTISAKSVGLNETVKTVLSVGEGGSIRAEAFYPGVHLRIGQAKMIIQETRRNLEIRFEDDVWVETFWKWEV
ncbi:MAG: DUF342 domain-containing protein [Firmicutes bacterium]|nr:DUF342 domain-containing protein [Bacillota bacterium]